LLPRGLNGRNLRRGEFAAIGDRLPACGRSTQQKCKPDRAGEEHSDHPDALAARESLPTINDWGRVSSQFIHEQGSRVRGQGSGEYEQ